ncbi:MAG TPA: protein kinase [Candidatus Polarisedimenticolia bacterium]|nr:protein kinase [Candidatus Polarisedimenticolia bacterium]
MTLAPGTRLGPYEIVAPLGAGGMGEVYRAHDARLKRDVAVKVLPAALSADPERLRRLQQEAQAAGALNHPNILTIFDIGTHEGTAYIVSELLEGRTLRALLQAGPIASRRALGLALQIAHGLDAAHARGIVHRDLKPENLFVTQDGRVKILDFGLAKLREEAPGSGAAAQEAITSLPTQHQGTAPGVVLGTLGYMSPEQVRGQATDGRSDVFAFGAILYEMLTGSRAFQRDTPADTISAILTKEPSDAASGSASALAPVLDRLVRHCLEKDPSRRFQSAHDLAFDLETLAGGAVTSEPGRVGEAAPAARHAGRRAGFFAAAGAALVAALGAGAFFFGRPATGGAVDSIAVLPFINAGHDPEMDYLSDGITESLINSLSKLPHLTVMSRNSVFHYKGKEVDAREAGEALKVKAVLTGRVVERGDALSISAELVDVRDNSHLWGGQYGGKASDVLAVQEEIARQISDNLRVKLTGEEKSRLAKRPTESNEAYQLYLKGRYFWNQRGKGLLRAADYFEQALQQDPGYAQAQAGAADTWGLLAFYGFRPAREAFPKAKAAAVRALEIDPALGEAHATLGYIAFTYDWNLDEAEREDLRALELSPNHPPAHYWYASVLSTRGDWDGSFRETEKALSLDPLSPFANIMMGWNHLRRGSDDQAVELLHKAIDFNPSIVLGHLLVGDAEVVRGRFPEAIAELKEAVRLSDGDAWVKGSLAHALAASGDEAGARLLLHELTEGPTPMGFRRSYPIALGWAGLKDADRAFAALDQARKERDALLSIVHNDRLFDRLHGDPRWVPYLRSIGLVPEAELAKTR